MWPNPGTYGDNGRHRRRVVCRQAVVGRGEGGTGGVEMSHTNQYVGRQNRSSGMLHTIFSPCKPYVV